MTHCILARRLTILADSISSHPHLFPISWLNQLRRELDRRIVRERSHLLYSVVCVLCVSL